jgi:hypothetical protein
MGGSAPAGQHPRRMVRLYRRTRNGLAYWEAWRDGAGQLVVHHGRAGERGHAEHLPAGPCRAGERLAARVARQRRRGYRELEHCEMRLVLVQWETGSRALLRSAQAWVDETLSWTGLGAYVGYEHSRALTIMGESVHAGLAVRVLAAGLPGSGLPADAVIAVCAGEDLIAWPPARVGEPLDKP